MTPVHEAAARQVKVDRLVAAFRSHVSGLGDSPSPTAVAGAAAGLPHRFWVDLAESIGVRSPSPATVAACVAHLRAAAAPCGDPFAGLGLA